MVKKVLILLVVLALIKGFVKGPMREADYLNSSTKVREFIMSEIEKEEDIETIKKNAAKLGRKEGLIVTFVDNYNSTKVNILLDLSNKYKKIDSFEIKD